MRELTNYALPSLWAAGSRPSLEEWEGSRRAELVDAFSVELYGRAPGGGRVIDVLEESRVSGALGGLATRSELLVTLAGPRGSRRARMLVYVPAAATRLNPAPVFLGYNMEGNQAITPESGITPSTAWYLDAEGMEPLAEDATDHERMAFLQAMMRRDNPPAAPSSSRMSWPIREIVRRGYGFATVPVGEIEEDRPGAAERGVRGMFATQADLDGDPEAWGTIAAWAWGLSRMLDALAMVPGVDPSAAIVHGTSRLGKTALWAGATDPRFAAVVANESGAGGASLFRHTVGGEDVHALKRDWSYWFCNGFMSCADEGDLTVDQHQLLALVAPRPLHVGSAELDDWADPRGEYLATLHASPIYGLHGLSSPLPPELVAPGADLSAADLADARTPEPGTEQGGVLSYHLRPGQHGQHLEDWHRYLEFAERNRLEGVRV